MQSIVIPIKINIEGSVIIPQEYLNVLPKEKLLKAIFEIPEFDSQDLIDLKNLTLKGFFNGYDEKDSIYDIL